MWGAVTAAALAGLALPSLAQGVSQGAAARPDSSTERLVVRFKPDSQPNMSALRADSQAASREAQRQESLRASLSGRAGHTLSAVRQMADGAMVYRTDTAMTLGEARAAAARLAQDSRVLDAAPDVRVASHAAALPNDPQAALQWVLPGASSASLGASGFLDAWPLSTGQGVVVAVVDTGWLTHPDLTGTVYPGYDFVSDPSMGSDGDGRDSDPADPGNACSSTGSSSSWHGLMVSGLIGATAGNGQGIAGLAPSVALLPVRAMGRCGGWLSDVADAVSWAAGKGSPANAHPAQVINLSLGSSAGTACFAYLQDAITRAVNAGVVVVASAGNDSSTTLSSPANCTGVIAVGAHTRSGDLAAYSNHSASLSLTAPGGGNCASQGASLCDNTPALTLGNAGTDGPGSPLDYRYFAGTSAAAPHVSAAAALMLALNPKLTPAQVKSTLQAQARAHPSSSWCAQNSGQCGAGMLNAAAAVQAVALPLITLQGPNSAVAGSTAVSLTASASGLGPFTYRWTQLSGTGVTLSGANLAQLSFTAPATRSTLSFKLDVTSANGLSNSALATVQVNNAPQLADQSLSQTGQAAFTLNLPAQDVDGDSLSYLLVSGPSGAGINGQQLFWPAPQIGTAVFQLRAEDPDGLSSGTASITLTIAAAGSNAGTDSSSGSLGTVSSGTSGSSTTTPTSTTTSVSSSSSGGGGGGALNPLALLGLMVAVGAIKLTRARPSAEAASRS
jgi:serine protease